VSELHPALALLAGALALPLVPARLRAAAFLAFALAALLLVVTLPAAASLAVPFLGWELVPLRVTPLARIFGLIFALVCALAGLYAYHLRDLGQQVAALLYGAGALAVTFAGDWLTLFVAWEVMAIASTVLVWARRDPGSERAGLRYLLTHLAGGSLLLAGIVLQAHGSGSVLMASFTPGESLAAWLILAGVALNAAIPPLHAWLPDAYPQATVTGAVFLSALTTKSAVYVLAAVFPGWSILVGLGVAMALYGVVYAVLANDIREILAYHIVSQVGYMVAGVGIGTAMALNGAAAHAFSHILYKALLFMGAGAVLHTTGRSRLAELGGILRHQRTVYALYMVGAFSISGFPLFNGFVSKSVVVAAAGEAQLYAAKLLLVLASVGTFLHTGLKLPYFTWHGPDRGLVPAKTPGTMIAAMAATAMLCLLFGVAPGLLYGLLPFPLDYRPYTLSHLVEATQLLTFTFVAFWVFRSRLAGEETIALDVDWLYRRSAPALGRVLVVGVDELFERCEAAVQRAARALARVAAYPAEALRSRHLPRLPFDPDRERQPVGNALSWTLLAVLGLSLLGLLR
jgi:multicomponent Na+:H+ antiporter subunit D